VLEKRAIHVPADIRERITSCTDLDTLTLWFDRSLTATAAWMASHRTRPQ
jgi:hypothetical protein